jgi:hypothetical protein
VNQYGYAGGDPINLSDPFGLTPYVQCRIIKNIFAAGYSHCAVRVRNEARGIDVMFELIPQSGKNAVAWRHGSEAAFGAPGSTYHAEQWTEVQRPAGMSEDEFDLAVLNAAVQEQLATQGKDYSEDGSKNSNGFVYNVLKKAGSSPPAGAEKGSGSPGLCGGKGRDTGTDCSKP